MPDTIDKMIEALRNCKQKTRTDMEQKPAGPEKTKLSCATCKFYNEKLWNQIFGPRFVEAKCKRPLRQEYDYVSGKTVTIFESNTCRTERDRDRSDTYCGKEGKFWQPRKLKYTYLLLTKDINGRN